MTRKKRPEFSRAIRTKIIERSGNRCERCNIDFDKSYKGEFHHIKPVCFGGKNNYDNCTLLCKKCHIIAPNVKNEIDFMIYYEYFLRFASFKEASKYYGVDTRY